MNDEGEVTELNLYSYCLKDEELETVLSYNTIDKLVFTKLFLDWNIDDRDDKNIIFRFGCASLPTNYGALSTLTNLKTLDLNGVKNLDYAMIASIPKSVEQLTIGRVILTQEMVDALSELTNLNKLTIMETEISAELDFSKFENLKNLSSLEIYYEQSYSLSPSSYVQGNLFMYCQSLKKLVIHDGFVSKNSFDGIGYLTELEELELNGTSFEDDVDFSSLKELKNLTSLDIYCSGYLANISPEFFNLTNLKKINLSNCRSTISTSLDDSLTWANLKNLEYINLSYNGPNAFDIEYLGDLPNLKEAYLAYNQYTAIPESIGNLKNLEILDLSNNAITSLPETIGNLEQLRILRISRNKIASLPEEIGNLLNLEQF